MKLAAWVEVVFRHHFLFTCPSDGRQRSVTSIKTACFRRLAATYSQHPIMWMMGRGDHDICGGNKMQLTAAMRVRRLIVAVLLKQTHRPQCVVLRMPTRCGVHLAK